MIKGKRPYEEEKTEFYPQKGDKGGRGSTKVDNQEIAKIVFKNRPKI